MLFFLTVRFTKVSEVVSQVRTRNVAGLIQNSKTVLCHKNKWKCPSQSNENSRQWGVDDKLLCELARAVIAEVTL